MPEAPANTRWFTYFPEDYRWSSGVVNCLSVAPWGGADIGEVDQVGRRLRKDIGNDALWFREWIRMANKVRALGLAAEENNHRLSAAYHHKRAAMYYQIGERFRTPKTSGRKTPTSSRSTVFYASRSSPTLPESSAWKCPSRTA